MIRIKVYFCVLIDWRSKLCMGSQKYQRIKLYDLHFVFGLIMISQKQIYCILYYYVDQLKNSSIVWWLFEHWYFVWQILKLLSIIEVNQLMMTCKPVDRLLTSMCTNVLRRAKTIGCWKGRKIATIFVQTWTYVGNDKEKRAILIWNW